MDLIFPDGMAYDCNACGRCCRTHWNVYVDPAAYERVRASDLYARTSARAGGDVIEHDQAADTARITGKHADGSCVFLDADRLCGIHRELGVGSKPLGCRQFPFVLTPTPDGIYVGLSFYCDAVQRGEGRPLEAHRAEIEGFLGENRYRALTDDNRFLDRGTQLDWAGYLYLERFVSACIDTSPDIREGLWRALLAIARGVQELREAGVERVTAADLEGVVHRHDLHGEIRDAMLMEQAAFFTLAVAGHLESSTAEAARGATQALMTGGVLESATHGRAIDLAGFWPYADRHPAEWRDKEVRRYLAHLIFRKYLARPQPFLYNLCGLQVAYSLLEIYFYLSAYAAGRAQPEQRDLWAAIDAVELGFAMHGARGGEAYFEAFGEGLLALLPTLDGASDAGQRPADG